MALMKLQTKVIKMETCPDANERQPIHLCAYVARYKVDEFHLPITLRLEPV